MFSSDVVKTDKFLDLDLKTQALYFHLGMSADDDGFIDAPKRLLREVGAQTDDLNALIDNDYIYYFNGVILIKHWMVNNHIRKDRYTPTMQKEYMKKVILNENNVYILDGIPDGTPHGIPHDVPSIDKVSIDKNSIGKEREEPTTKKEKETKHKYGEFKHVLLTDTQYEDLKKTYGETLEEHIKLLDEYIEQSGKAYKNYSLVLKGWVHEKYTKLHQNTSIKLDNKFYEKKTDQTEEEIQAQTKELMERMRNGTLIPD